MDEQINFNAPLDRFASYGRFSLSFALPPLLMSPPASSPPLSDSRRSPQTSPQMSSPPLSQPSSPLPPFAPMSAQVAQAVNTARPSANSAPDAGAIAGGVIGGVIGLLLLVLLMAVVWRRTQAGPSDASLRQVNQKVDTVALALHEMAREVKELNGRAIVLVENDMPEDESEEEEGTRRLDVLPALRSPKRLELRNSDRCGSPGHVSPVTESTAFPSATPSELAPESPPAVPPVQSPPWVPVVPVDAPRPPQHVLGDSSLLATSRLPPALPDQPYMPAAATSTGMTTPPHQPLQQGPSHRQGNSGLFRA